MYKNLLLVIMVFALINAQDSIAQDQFTVLVFSKTDGFRHESIHEGVDAIKNLGIKHSFGVTWTDDAKVFNEEQLSEFDVVVFLNNSGDILNEEQQKSFRQLINKGGGFVGVHGATTVERDWPWYGKLVGRYFAQHPEIQTAEIKVIDKNFPATYHLNDTWLWTDEWYEFEEQLADDLNVLITVDETTYEQTEGMGDFHPLAWYHEFDGGRAFYTALGHIGVSYSDPDFLNHIYGGIYWAAGAK